MRLSSRIEADLSRVIVRTDWSYDDLSDLEVLIILLEDRRFFQHSGIDIYSVAREMIRMLSFKPHGGASTIDMQFVRMRTGYKQRRLWRKLYEMMLAWLLQSRMNKVDILRAYTREMYLGSHLYGVKRAARSLFKKELHELELRESALIAAMMVYPRPLHPDRRWEEKAARRAAYGVTLFKKMGHQYKRSVD